MLPYTPRLDFGDDPRRAVAYIDGGSQGNPGQAGFGVHILDPGGKSLKKIYGYLGIKTNNYAEYAALLAALEFARQHHITWLEVYSDSELIVKQIKGVYQVKHPDLRKLHTQAMSLIKELDTFRIKHIPREANKEADRLAATAIKKKASALIDE